MCSAQHYDVSFETELSHSLEVETEYTGEMDREKAKRRTAEEVQRMPVGHYHQEQKM